jgi:hypothetical protein
MRRGEAKILKSWKPIAAHLTRRVRTCQIKESNLGLPVLRLGGSPEARVLARADEIVRRFDGSLHREIGERMPIFHL